MSAETLVDKSKVNNTDSNIDKETSVPPLLHAKTCKEAYLEYEEGPLIMGQILNFDILPGLTPSNLTAPISLNGQETLAVEGADFIAVRGDTKEKYLSRSEVMVCRNGGNIWQLDQKVEILDNAEDPSWTFIDGQLVLTVVRLTDARRGHLRFHQEFFVLDPNDLKFKFLVRGPQNHKDIRLGQRLGQKKIHGLSRPQEQELKDENGQVVDVLYKGFGKGKIGYFALESIDELRDQEAFLQKIKDSVILEGQFNPAEREWGGANEIWVTEDDQLDTLAHWAYEDQDERGNTIAKHYFGSRFFYDPPTNLKTDMEIIFARRNFDIPLEASKGATIAQQEESFDIVFPGGRRKVLRDRKKVSPDLIEHYTGVADANSGKIILLDSAAKHRQQLKAMIIKNNLKNLAIAS